MRLFHHFPAARACLAKSACLAAAGLFLVPQRGARAQQTTASVSATLVDRTTKVPVEGARITVLGTGLGASSDVEGRFELSGVPTGVRVLQARAIGYAVSSWMIELTDGQVLRQTLELERRAIQMDTINVAVATESYAGWRSESAFDLRRQRHMGGFFLGRQDIQQRHALNIADLLRLVPGVMTNCTSRGCTVRMDRGTRACSPEYFLDGYPATFSTGPNFPITQIRGVEIYRDYFEAPAEFQRPNLSCGIIAIWTIEPGTPLERH